MLQDHYDKTGTKEAPVCACHERALSFAIDVDSPIVLYDCMGTKVPLKRIPTDLKAMCSLWHREKQSSGMARLTLFRGIT